MIGCDSDRGAVTIESERELVPDPIKGIDIWTLWDLHAKQPLAPWHTGNCYPAKWNSTLEAEERPETDYQTARDFADLEPRQLHKTHPFPEGPTRVVPTILLPHEPDEFGYPSKRRLMYIDFDDVRDPETGEVSEEVAAIINRLDSYADISVSETGLHVLVWAELPEGITAITGEPLDGPGSIEMYDQSRFFGGTWRHVAGTPTRINERQDIVEELLERYCSNRLSRGKNRDESGENQGVSAESSSNSTPSDGHTQDRSAGSVSDRIDALTSPPSGDSPYYDADLEDFAEPEETVTKTTNKKESGKGPQGPHPAHGKTTSGDESINYHLDPNENRWHCFAHMSGGGPLEMAAVMAGTMHCRDAGKGSLNRLTDREFLETCLYARDELDGFETDAKPPYRAIRAVAQLTDLPMADADEGILGRIAYRSACVIYNEISRDDLDSLGER